MRILTGFQPSGVLHLGNYFGAMKPAIELQEKGETFYFIADYHSLTSMGDPNELEARVRGVALDFLACGFDPSRGVFFRQSAVPEVHELAWYLSVVTPMGLLERCHSYKDKIARGISPNHGLFAYPVLMAADILMYDTDLVPVGQDQRQHLEVTRDIAQKFNEFYGEVLRIPEAKIQDDVASLPGLDGQKMSKSYNNIIEIFSNEEVFRKRIMSIKTDSTPVESPKPIDNSVIIALAQCVGSKKQVDEMIQSMQTGGKGYGDYKKQLFEMAWEYFEPYRVRRNSFTPGDVEDVLKAGAVKAREYADRTLARVRKAVGMRR